MYSKTESIEIKTTIYDVLSDILCHPITLEMSQDENFIQIMKNGRQIKRCKNCGKYFVLTDNRNIIGEIFVSKSYRQVRLLKIK